MTNEIRINLFLFFKLFISQLSADDGLPQQSTKIEKQTKICTTMILEVMPFEFQTSSILSSCATKNFCVLRNTGLCVCRYTSKLLATMEKQRAYCNASPGVFLELRKFGVQERNFLIYKVEMIEGSDHSG